MSPGDRLPAGERPLRAGNVRSGDPAPAPTHTGARGLHVRARSLRLVFPLSPSGSHLNWRQSNEYGWLRMATSNWTRGSGTRCRHLRKRHLRKGQRCGSTGPSIGVGLWTSPRRSHRLLPLYYVNDDIMQYGAAPVLIVYYGADGKQHDIANSHIEFVRRIPPRGAFVVPTRLRSAHLPSPRIVSINGKSMSANSAWRHMSVRRELRNRNARRKNTPRVRARAASAVRTSHSLAAAGAGQNALRARP